MTKRTAEDRLIGWLRTELNRRGLVDRLGDDVAWLTLGGAWAVSADQQIEGTHFGSRLPAWRLGRRLAAVNLSDMAAAGARPRFATATVAAPRNFDFKAFFRGLLDSCEEFGLSLIGGDLASTPRVTTTLTVFGQRPRGAQWLRRDRAQPGDVLWLGGSVGESALGRALLERGVTVGRASVRLPGNIPNDLRTSARSAIARHLLPVPQLELGAWLGRRRRAAAIDVSDGVVLDLERLVRASAVGCVLDAAALPLSRAFAELATFVGLKPERLALAGGEDYVLLFALPPRIRPPRAFAATAVGRIVPKGGRARIQIDGAKEPAQKLEGWDHLSR